MSRPDQKPWVYDDESDADELRRMEQDDAEYRRGVEDTKHAQEAGPAGSEAREQAYREMEAQWEREGFDG
jgi:hypothetical protein